MFKDIDADIAVLGVLDGILHLEAVAGGDSHTSKQQVDIGAAVGSAKLDSLLVAEVHLLFRLQRVAVGHHIAAALGPTKRHAHHSAAVAVAPADVGRSLLVGHQTEIAGGVGVAESGQ